MQPSDTAYPRFKTRLTQAELDQFYTPTDEELTFCASVTLSPTTRLGFAVLLKTFQRLGYFVPSHKVPEAIIEHIATVINRRVDRDGLSCYDQSEARRKHLPVVRGFLGVKYFSAQGKTLLRTTLSEAALTKEDVADIVNVGIEILVRHRYELPAFDTLVREARAGRAATNQTLYEKVQCALGKTGAVCLDALFIVGEDSRRVSPWHDIKQDTAKPTVHGMRDLLVRFDQLTALSNYNTVLKTIPIVKVSQWALEGNALDAASMADLAPSKRYAVTLAVIRQRLAIVTDDLCDVFCKQMSRVSRIAGEKLQKYLTDSQGKMDEILRRYALLDTVLSSTESDETQLQEVRQTISDRPDLCEFSRLHTEYGGKNECRFMKPIFANRRAELLRILSTLRFVSTSQDLSFERALTLMLAQRGRHSEWIALKSGTAAYLSLSDLAWVPEKWWKLITGDQQRAAPTRLNRRQFEACVCVQMVRELKSADLCVIGANNYSDTRDELVPLDECAQTREAYGQEVGLPVQADTFIQHVRGLLTTAAKKADEAYHENPFFQIIDGRPKLCRIKKKPIPEGFQALDAALTKKLDKLELSLLDVLADTSQWIGWDKHLGPLSGYQGKIKEDVRRKILTTFAYGTGLGPTQTARNIADISARQISFVDQRQASTEKLEAAICDIINVSGVNYPGRMTTITVAGFS